MQVYELLGPFLFSHVLADFCDQIPFNSWNLSSVWYYDDGTVVETWPAVLEFLHQVKLILGQSFGLRRRTLLAC